VPVAEKRIATTLSYFRAAMQVVGKSLDRAAGTNNVTSGQGAARSVSAAGPDGGGAREPAPNRLSCFFLVRDGSGCRRALPVLDDPF
jgi:hypothetical protein